MARTHVKDRDYQAKPGIYANKSGKVYLNASEFFQRKSIKETVEKLLNSSITKKIDEHNQNFAH